MCIGEGSLVRLLCLLVSSKYCGRGWNGSRYWYQRISLIDQHGSGFWIEVSTFVPASSTLPSVLQARVNGSPPTSSFAIAFFVLVSQNRTVPSPEQLASSNSLTGLKKTFSTVWPCPFSSVWLRGLVRSGFHIRMVLSLAPVAINPPETFQEIVRWL